MTRDIESGRVLEVPNGNSCLVLLTNGLGYASGLKPGDKITQEQLWNRMICCDHNDDLNDDSQVLLIVEHELLGAFEPRAVSAIGVRHCTMEEIVKLARAQGMRSAETGLENPTI